MCMCVKSVFMLAFASDVPAVAAVRVCSAVSLLLTTQLLAIFTSTIAGKHQFAVWVPRMPTA